MHDIHVRCSDGIRGDWLFSDVPCVGDEVVLLKPYLGCDALRYRVLCVEHYPEPGNESRRLELEDERGIALRLVEIEDGLMSRLAYWLARPFRGSGARQPSRSVHFGEPAIESKDGVSASELGTSPAYKYETMHRIRISRFQGQEETWLFPIVPRLGDEILLHGPVGNYHVTAIEPSAARPDDIEASLFRVRFVPDRDSPWATAE